MKKKTSISKFKKKFLKIKVSAKKKEGVRRELVIVAKKKENIRTRLVVTAKRLAATAKEKENIRTRLVVTAKRLAATAKEKENIRTRLVVTAKRLAATASELFELKAEYEAILFSIGDAVLACNKAGKVVFFNKIAQTLSGYSTAEVVGYHYKKVLKFVREDDEKTSDDFIARALSTGKITEMINHTLLITKDGEKISVADSAAPIRNTKGEITGCVVVFRDVSKEREIERVKNEFVSLASHQLRTPLTTISWYTEMILNGQAGPFTPKQTKYLEEIYQGNHRMIELVNTLLDVSRIELGTKKFEQIKTNVNLLIESLITEQKIKIKEKNLVITTNFSKNIPLLLTDPKSLYMVFQNLLSNSVKYIPSGGKIEFSTSLDDAKKTILIKISDTGYGIPKRQQYKIFTKFFRGDNVRVRDTSGTGLGLYIVKSIIKNLGGEIRFESEENKGTTFYVMIPLDRGVFFK